MAQVFAATASEPSVAPPAYMVGVGPGDFWSIGETTVELLSDWAGLTPSDRVLDVGCGLGRVAWPLSRRLGLRGRYVGFDAVLPCIVWCQQHLGLDPHRFFFCYYPLRSTAYQSRGSEEAPEAFEFPWEPGVFSLAIATSLFTHLMPEVTEHYLRQIRRVLAPEGRVFASFFIVDEDSLARLQAKQTYPVFEEQREWGWIHDPLVPDDGVAFHREWLLKRFENAGFAIRDVHHGSWRGGSAPYYQDVIVAVVQ